MYDSQVIAGRIKTRTKSCGFTMKTMLTDLGLGENAVLQLSKGHGMSYLNLAKIADYLDCSVDYLLGRTEEPQKLPESSIIKGNVNNSTNFGNHNSISISATAEAQNEINSILSVLTPRERTELMMMIYQFADQHTA